jgi:hypothetical protein
MRGAGAGACSLGLVVLACQPPNYRHPTLPPQQMALVTVEERAVVKTVDGARPLNPAGAPSHAFWISGACNALDVRYEETYVRSRGAAGILLWSPLTAVVSVAASAAATAANTKVSTYETDMPIRFNLPGRSGLRYWITSTFTGDVFMPRVAVLNAANERVAVILPNQPCR